MTHTLILGDQLHEHLHRHQKRPSEDQPPKNRQNYQLQEEMDTMWLQEPPTWGDHWSGNTAWTILTYWNPRMAPRGFSVANMQRSHFKTNLSTVWRFKQPNDIQVSNTARWSETRVDKALSSVDMSHAENRTWASKMYLSTVAGSHAVCGPCQWSGGTPRDRTTLYVVLPVAGRHTRGWPLVVTSKYTETWSHSKWLLSVSGRKTWPHFIYSVPVARRHTRGWTT